MRVNRRGSIWKHARLADGKWRYCRPVLDANGKIVPDMVTVNGDDERHPEGSYVISFYNPTLTWKKCGKEFVIENDVPKKAESKKPSGSVASTKEKKVAKSR